MKNNLVFFSYDDQPICFTFVLNLMFFLAKKNTSSVLFDHNQKFRRLVNYDREKRFKVFAPYCSTRKVTERVIYCFSSNQIPVEPIQLAEQYFDYIFQYANYQQNLPSKKFRGIMLVDLIKLNSAELIINDSLKIQHLQFIILINFKQMNTTHIAIISAIKQTYGNKIRVFIFNQYSLNRIE
jgi:hypothetical protein